MKKIFTGNISGCVGAPPATELDKRLSDKEGRAKNAFWKLIFLSDSVVFKPQLISNEKNAFDIDYLRDGLMQFDLHDITSCTKAVNNALGRYMTLRLSVIFAAQTVLRDVNRYFAFTDKREIRFRQSVVIQKK